MYYLQTSFVCFWDKVVCGTKLKLGQLSDIFVIFFDIFVFNLFLLFHSQATVTMLLMLSFLSYSPKVKAIKSIIC